MKVATELVHAFCAGLFLLLFRGLAQEEEEGWREGRLKK